MIIECEYCHKKFERLDNRKRRNDHNFCSTICSHAFHKIDNNKKRTCLNCNKLVGGKSYHVIKSPFCCEKCKKEYLGNKAIRDIELKKRRKSYCRTFFTRTCRACGKKFESPEKELDFDIGAYCSITCAQKALNFTIRKI